MSAGVCTGGGRWAGQQQDCQSPSSGVGPTPGPPSRDDGESDESNMFRK